MNDPESHLADPARVANRQRLMNDLDLRVISPETAIITGAIPEPSTAFLLMLATGLFWKRRSYPCQ